eukprot:TRINITY_DN19518_c0_g1_i1.p1 TRINITY_DN19518_c0_g1~~TRINITY_DN19518_c0_g1_i1.p1  ORF type:complete len:312 (+),score=61.35 TRINITY_DN19518_c0_g1_i1:62-997(+)
MRTRYRTSIWCILAIAVMMVAATGMSIGINGDDKRPVRVIAFSDTHYESTSREYVIDAVRDLIEGISSTTSLQPTALFILGDTKDEGKGQTKSQVHNNLKTITSEINTTWGVSSTKPIFWVLGNHDVDRLTKQEWAETVSTPDQRTYYRKDISSWLSIVVIDSGYYNESSPWSCLSCSGVHVGWNATLVPSPQLKWLRTTLLAIKNERRKAVVLSHARIDIPHNDWEGNRTVLNAAAVRSTFPDKTVPLVITGHDHKANHSPTFISGTLHYTLPAVVENPTIPPLIDIQITRCSLQITGRGPAPSISHFFC